MNEYAKYMMFKSAIEELFGSDAWYALKESNHIPTWRKYGIRTLKSVGIAIDATIEVYDDEWRKSIDEQLAEGIKRIKMNRDIDEIIATLAGTVIRITFLQIGLMPNRKGSQAAIPLRRDAWCLNQFRSVIYTQTSEQKERLFWSKQRKEIGFHAQLELHAKYRQSEAKTLYSEWCKNGQNT